MENSLKEKRPIPSPSKCSPKCLSQTKKWALTKGVFNHQSSYNGDAITCFYFYFFLMKHVSDFDSQI